MDAGPGKRIGRGSQLEPPNRFERMHLEADREHADPTESDGPARRLTTQFLPDRTRRIIVSNDSSDIPFRFSINPYRGCEHGCAYCYARPGHEYLGLNAGLDFESKILVKHDAAELLRAELAEPSWQGDMLAISGVTDCYQPAERRFRLTRGLLEVLLEARNALGLITKNALVARDLDLLAPLAELRLVHVYLSVTTLDAELARTLEPRTSPPQMRLQAIARLCQAGVPVGVMAAPIIPGLNDHELPAILTAAKEAGAQTAGYTLLRLPMAVGPIFTDWLARHRPLAAERVLNLIRSTHDGKLNASQFGRRMRGAGPYAEQIQQTFRVFAARLGLDQRLPPVDLARFRPPAPRSGQLRLF